MIESPEVFMLAILRASCFLTISAIAVATFLRWFEIQSVKLHRIAWIAVLLQGVILCTVNIELPMGTPEVIPTAVMDAQPPALEFSALPAEDPFHAPFAVGPVTQRSQSVRSVPLWTMFFWVWLFGAVLCVGWQSVRYLQLIRSLPRDSQVEIVWKQEWSDVCREAGINTEIPLTLVDGAGPALCRTLAGYTLLLPNDRWGDLTRQQRACVLRHELAHYEHGDLWKAVAFQLLATIHWFNPLAWLAVRRLAECAEWSCDAIVRTDAHIPTPEYIRTLMLFSTPPQRLPTMIPAAAGHSLVRRAERLLKPRFKEDSQMKKLTLLLIVTVLATANGFAFDTSPNDEPKNITEQNTENTKDRDGIDSDDRQAGSKSSDPFAEVSLSRGTNDSGIEVGLNLSLALPAESSEGDGNSVQNTKRATNGISSSEAVIDVNHIFKRLPEFQRLKKDLERQLKSQEKGLQKERKALQALSQKLKRETDSEEQEELKSEIERRHSKMQLEVAQSRRKLKSQEAEMYATVYRKLRQAVAVHAKENGIQIVRRTTINREQQKRLESGDPQAVLQAMNEQVLYIADEAIDITDAVLERLIKADKAELAKDED